MELGTEYSAREKGVCIGGAGFQPAVLARPVKNRPHDFGPFTPNCIRAVLVAVCLAWGPYLRAEPLVTNAGLGTLLHPIQEPAAVPRPSCYNQGPCRCCKEHVYVFGVNGLNPLCLGNFNGLLSYLKKQGFHNTYFGQLYTCYWFADKIREIRRTDPEARVCLIGFSLGANSVRTIANSLAGAGIKVDLLVYLVGDLIGNNVESRPPNVGRIVNIRANGLILTGGDLTFNGAEIDGAVNKQLHCRHILAPSRRETLAMMMHELMTLACFPETKTAVRKK